MTIRRLEQVAYQGYEIELSYTTMGRYDVTREEDSFLIQLVSYEKPVIKHSKDLLFQPWWDKPQAYGCFDQDKLVGVIEFCDESYSGRLRITNLMLQDAYRRLGLGTKLMDIAVEYAKVNHYREVILETQNVNLPAIAFYKHYGFRLVGIDTTEYLGNPTMQEEVRFEMALTL